MKYTYRPVVHYIIEVNPELVIWDRLRLISSYMLYRVQDDPDGFDDLLLILSTKILSTDIACDPSKWFDERYRWLKKNTESFSFDENGFHFKNESDMVIFKLRFP